MSLTVGQLRGFLDLDDSGWRLGLRRAERGMAGLQRDANGRLRDARGRFARAGEESGHGFVRRLVSSIGHGLRQGLAGAVSTGMHGLSGLQSALSSNPYAAAGGLGLAAAIVGSALPAIAAALSTAVIAVGGLAVVGVGYKLVKDLPEVKKALGSLKKTTKEIFKDAADVLANDFAAAFGDVERMVKRLQPQIQTIFQSAQEWFRPLIRGFTDLVENAMPGFVSMIKNSTPTFEGLSELLSDVGTGVSGFFKEIGKSSSDTKVFLQDLGELLKGTFIAAGWVIGKLASLYHHVHDFVANVIGAFQWLYDVLVGHSIIPDLVNAIVMWILSLPGRILGGLAGFVASVIGWFAHMAAGGTREASRMVSGAVHWLAGLPGRAASAMGSLGSRVASVAYSAGRRLLGAVRSGVSSSVAAVAGLPGRAARALGGIGSRLYSSGRALVSGFVSGIWSMIGRVRSAASSIVGAARRFFPFSPAKEGPFSGKGWTLYSGQSLIRGFQQGIAGQLPALQAQLGAMPGVPAMVGPSGAAAAGRPQPVPVVLRVQGDNEDLVKLIQGWVRTQGGGDVASLAGG
jgi:phage-related protein